MISWILAYPSTGKRKKWVSCILSQFVIMDTMCRLERQLTTGLEKIFASQISDKGLKTTIYRTAIIQQQKANFIKE